MQENVWQLQEAKARFSALVRAAEMYPQTVTVHGKNRVIMLSWPYFRQLMETVMEREKRGQPSVGS